LFNNRYEKLLVIYFTFVPALGVIMSNLASGSVVTEDKFLEFDDEIIDSENIDDTATEPVNSGENNFDAGGINIHTAFLDARRRLELRIAERDLEKDIKEFDFDI
jgi:hypothetical protein